MLVKVITWLGMARESRENRRVEVTIIVADRQGVRHRKQSEIHKRKRSRLEREEEKIVQTNRLAVDLKCPLILHSFTGSTASDPVMAGLVAHHVSTSL